MDCPQNSLQWSRIKRNISDTEIPRRFTGSQLQPGAGVPGRGEPTALAVKTRDDSAILCGTGGCWKPRPRLKHYAHRLSHSQAPTLGSGGGTVTQGALLASGVGEQMEGCGFGARARGHSPFSLCKQQAAAILAFFNSTPTWINVNLNRSGVLCWKPTHSIPPTPVTFSMNSQTCP